jgi:hypothetical protein
LAYLDRSVAEGSFTKPKALGGDEAALEFAVVSDIEVSPLEAVDYVAEWGAAAA